MDAESARRTRVETLPAEELTRLLGQLGHEVGTPLGSVLMMSEMLADTADPALRRRAEGLKQAATEVRDAVQSFVQLLRLRTGWFSPRSTEVSGDAILRSIRAGATSAKTSVATMEITVSQTPPDGHLDLDYLRDAVECICTWAERCSPGARMDVGVEAGLDSDPGSDSPRVRCTIRCAGPDVPWGEAAIFDPIGEGDLVAARRHGGPGLQLALAAALVWRLGGELTGRSESTGAADGAENVLHLQVPIRIDDPLEP